MKLKLAVLSLSGLFLFACTNENIESSNEANQSTEIEENANDNKETEVTTEDESKEEKPVITDLDTAGEIKSDGEVMYSVQVTDVVDVTEEARNELLNESNFLDYYSSGQAEQAVRIAILMKNNSGEQLSLPYLDEVMVVDSEGVTNLGGWKNESGSKVEFGYYTYDSEGNINEDLYVIDDGESAMATSTVLFANNSDQVTFKFESQLYNDYIEFNLPIQ